MDKQTRLCPECGKEGWLEVADTRTTPTPPTGQVEAVADSFEDTRNRQLATMQWQDILAFADAEIKGKVLFKKFIAGTPLENDIPVWMAEYAARYQQAALKASGAEHIAGLAKASIDIASFAQHDEDCHINNWGENQIPECTCGYTSAQGALCDILDALPPELRGK